MSHRSCQAGHAGQAMVECHKNNAGYAVTADEASFESHACHACNDFMQIWLVMQVMQVIQVIQCNKRMPYMSIKHAGFALYWGKAVYASCESHTCLAQVMQVLPSMQDILSKQGVIVMLPGRSNMPCRSRRF